MTKHHRLLDYERTNATLVPVVNVRSTYASPLDFYQYIFPIFELGNRSITVADILDTIEYERWV